MDFFIWLEIDRNFGISYNCYITRTDISAERITIITMLLDKLKMKMAKPAFKKGKQLDAQKNYSQAAQMYQKAIHKYPRYADAYYNLNVDYHYLGMYQKEIKILHTLIGMNPNNDAYYNDLGVTYDNLGQVKLAIAAYQKATTIDPKFEREYVYIAKDYQELKDYRHEILAYKQAINVSAKYNYYNCIGVAYAAMHDYKSAIAFYKEALRINPQVSVIYNNLADVYHDVKDYLKEISVLKRAVKIDERSDYDNRIGVAYERVNNNTDAEKYYQKAISKNGNKAVYYSNLASIELDDKQKIANLKSAISLDANNDRLYNQIGNVYYDVKNYRAAWQYYQDAININASKSVYYDKLGRAEDHLSNYGSEAAVKEYTNALGINPKDRQALKDRSVDYKKLGNYQAQIKDLKKLISLEPHNDVNYTDLGFAYYRLGDFKPALKYYKQALTINPNINQNNEAITLSNIAQSDKCLAKAADNQRNATEYYHDSIESSKRALRLYPKYEMPYSILGEDYISLKQYQDAVRVLTDLIDINNNNYYYYHQLGLAYAGDDDYRRAVAMYQRAFSFKPKLDDRVKARYYKDLADVQAKINVGYATSNYQQAVELDPKNKDYRQALEHNRKQVQTKKYSENIDNDMKQLKRLAGLDDVKASIGSYVNTKKIDHLLGKKGKSGVIDLVFEGARGTGKKTVARLLSKILYDIGTLRVNKFVKVNGKDLIGEYVGQSKVKTRHAVNSSLNGVLYIDNAGTLAIDPQDPDNNGFKREAVAELVAAVENHRDEVVVIMAGPEPQIKDLFKNCSPKLADLFKDRLLFNGYTNDECLDILKLMLANNHVKVSPNASDELKDHFTKVVAKERQIKGTSFGNGNYVKKIMAKLIATKNNRLGGLDYKALLTMKQTDPELLQTLTLSDVQKML